MPRCCRFSNALAAPCPGAAATGSRAEELTPPTADHGRPAPDTGDWDSPKAYPNRADGCDRLDVGNRAVRLVVRLGVPEGANLPDSRRLPNPDFEYNNWAMRRKAAGQVKKRAKLRTIGAGAGHHGNIRESPYAEGLNPHFGQPAQSPVAGASSKPINSGSTARTAIAGQSTCMNSENCMPTWHKPQRGRMPNRSSGLTTESTPTRGMETTAIRAPSAAPQDTRHRARAFDPDHKMSPKPPTEANPTMKRSGNST